MYLWHVVKIMHAHLLYWVSNQKLQSITLYTLQSTGTYTAAAAAAATTYYVLYYTHDITESPPRSARRNRLQVRAGARPIVYSIPVMSSV